VLVERLEVRVGGRGVEVVIQLLDVFAVVALGVAQAEQALLEDRVVPVPQGEGQAKELIPVAQAGEAVLAPAVGAAAGLVVRQVVPGDAALAVVLADGAPLAVAEVGAPFLPALPDARVLVQAVLFGAHEAMVLDEGAGHKYPSRG